MGPNVGPMGVHMGFMGPHTGIPGNFRQHPALGEGPSRGLKHWPGDPAGGAQGLNSGIWD